MTRRRVLILVGPTAVGKTAVAVELAQRLSGTIISCDAMQVYRGLAVLTSAPPREVLRRVPHAFIGTLEARAEWNAAQFAQEAAAACRAAAGQRIPIVVGGSGLYCRALVDGLFEGAGRDPLIRARLTQEAERIGDARLHARLAGADPVTAGAVHPHDRRRIIRALEIQELTGQPASLARRRTVSPLRGWDVVLVGLRRPLAALEQRIRDRTETMVARGVVEEVRRVAGGTVSETARRAVGYEAVCRHLAGALTRAEVVEQIVRETRQYARHQMTWFRKDPRVVWLEVGEREAPAATVTRVLAVWRARERAPRAGRNGRS